MIAGNHDWCFQQQPKNAVSFLTGCQYLFDQAVTLDGLTVYGSPWQPWFHDWAFNLQRGAEIAAKWTLIPPGIDLLVTYGPPRGHGDRTWLGEEQGCADLLAAVTRVRPRLHVFGHIHEGAGITRDSATVFINASCCDPFNAPVNLPVVFDLVTGD